MVNGERITVNYLKDLCDEKYWSLVPGDDEYPKPHFVLGVVPMVDLKNILLEKKLQYTSEIYQYLEGNTANIKHFRITKHYIFVDNYTQEDLMEDEPEFFDSMVDEDTLVTDLICDIIKETKKIKKFDEIVKIAKDKTKNNNLYYWPHVKNQLTMYWIRCNRNHKLACRANTINGLEVM